MSKKSPAFVDTGAVYPITGASIQRPVLGWKKLLLKFIIYIIIDSAVSLLFARLISAGSPGLPEDKSILIKAAIIFAVLTVLFILIRIKQTIIFMIRLYQRFAPLYLRARCVYIPSCSEYMILAIEKYGLVDGIKRGWARLDRCGHPNEGEDWP